jgi:hypothetical protein
MGQPGLTSSSDTFRRRVSAREVLTFADLYPSLRPGELTQGTDDPRFRDSWKMVSPSSFGLAG